MINVDMLIEDLLKREGGYVNDPSDSGGETNFGITLMEARQNGYSGDMKLMSRDFAKIVYMNKYWLKPKFDQVAARAPKVGAEIFDTGVNMGIYWAGYFLQRLLNALNRGGTDYADLKLDGEIGLATIGALDSFLHVRGTQGELILLHGLDALQGERYVELCEKNPKNEKFLFGWLATRIGNVQ